MHCTLRHSARFHAYLLTDARTAETVCRTVLILTRVMHSGVSEFVLVFICEGMLVTIHDIALITTATYS